MERISIIENFVPKNDEALLRMAEKHRPALRHKRVAPVAAVVQRVDGTTETVSPETIPPLGAGESVCYDFGNHFVGYVTLQLSFAGSHPDAPAYLDLQFAERESELHEDAEAYHGWISKSWIQRELVHIDKLPHTLVLPRRYALRYCRVRVIDTSRKYRVVPQSLTLRAVGTADPDRIAPLETDDERLRRIDKIGVRTLANCMQEVFEDGPKRDRRLWIGDLRLQALANYRTYRNNDLVRRCLYLFAGSTLPGGRVGAGLFIEPEVEVDDTAMFDYSLFFIPTLLDYYEATGDKETLRELWPTALRQVELAQASFDGSGLVRDSDVLGWCFLDWNLALNKQCGAQGVYLYCLKAAEKIAALLGAEEEAARLASDYAAKKQAALDSLFDKDLGLFVSGRDRQLSWASQIWMVLGGAADGAVLARIAARPDAVGMVTPYLYHHYVQALLDVGEKEAALQVLRDYWGGMLREGADTFWELYDPADPDASPYGGTIVNSYCHAWSCAPAYFLRKYYNK